ncbi:MAG: AI-2E family transporter [Pseudobdellovibrio sp.]
MNIKFLYVKYAIQFFVYFSFVALFWPFKKSILFASLFALALSPFISKFESRIRNEKILILGILSGLLGIFFLPLSILVIKGLINFSHINQSGLTELPIYKNSETAVLNIFNSINSYAQQFGFNLSEQFNVQDLIGKITSVVVPILTDAISQLPGFFLQFLVFLTCLYFLMLRRKNIFSWVNELNIIPEKSLIGMIQFLQKVCYTIVVSTVVIASIQALIISLAALMAGYNDFLILFMLAFFMSFVPVIGSAPISISLALYNFMQSQIFSGIVLLIAALAASIIDNVIKTFVLSQAEDAAHPLISLLALIGAMAMFGISGLFLGPILSQLAFSVHKMFKLSQPVMIENEHDYEI